MSTPFCALNELPWALRTRMDETGVSLIPKDFRIEFLGRRRQFIMLLGGAVAAWPLAARAQQPGAMPRIGLLSVFAESDPEGQALIKELMQGLQELGWVNGRNVRIDFRFGGADAAHISTLATELIELRPDVVLAAGALAATALRQQTLSIPIVFVQVVDPVSAGFVTNLARPEG